MTDVATENVVVDADRVERIENALGGQGIASARSGSLEERLNAAAGALGGLGLSVESDVAAVEQALAGFGINLAEFDTTRQATERQAVLVKAQAEAATEATAKATQEKAAAQAALERAQAEVEQAAKARRLNLLEFRAAQLATDAEAKFADAATIKERADEAAVELAAARSGS